MVSSIACPKAQLVKIEKLTGEVGDKVTLADVLFIGGNGEVKIGAPLVANAKVTGEIVEPGAGEKDHRLQEKAAQKL